MKRNWYALGILAALVLLFWAAGRYVTDTTEQMEQELQTAYANTLTGDYELAKTAYQTAAQNALKHSETLVLLVRRNLLEQTNQTLCVLAEYASPDNQADLAVETARACTQIRQLRASFFGRFGTGIQHIL